MADSGGITIQLEPAVKPKGNNQPKKFFPGRKQFFQFPKKKPDVPKPTEYLFGNNVTKKTYSEIISSMKGAELDTYFVEAIKCLVKACSLEIKTKMRIKLMSRHVSSVAMTRALRVACKTQFDSLVLFLIKDGKTKCTVSALKAAYKHKRPKNVKILLRYCNYPPGVLMDFIGRANRDIDNFITIAATARMGPGNGDTIKWRKRIHDTEKILLFLDKAHRATSGTIKAHRAAASGQSSGEATGKKAKK